jgi:hypothetical protein
VPWPLLAENETARHFAEPPSCHSSAAGSRLNGFPDFKASLLKQVAIFSLSANSSPSFLNNFFDSYGFADVGESSLTRGPLCGFQMMLGLAS